MGGALDRLKAKYPNGIPVKNPDGVAELVASKAEHLDITALREDLAAVGDAIAANDREKALLGVLAMLTKAGLEVALPG